MPDLLVKNASVIDGSGTPAFDADIVISKGEISRIIKANESEPAPPCPEVLDARDLVLCPGFIDMHTHSDFTLLLAPKADSRVRQGVTTEVTGNCGGSPGPFREAFREPFMEYMKDFGRHYKQELSDGDWNRATLDDFFSLVSRQGTALNVAPLVGHSTLRVTVMGYADRSPDAGEMAGMKRLLEQELEKGAFGLSTGLIYHPGAFAGPEELAGLAAVLPRYNGIYSTHMRSEAKYLFEAVQEAIGVARQSKASLQISHLKCESPACWGKSRELLKMLDTASSQGIDLHFDQYPYTAWATGMIELFPPWTKEKGAARLIEILNDPAQHLAVKDQMRSTDGDWENPMAGLGWDMIRITGCRLAEHLPFNGMRVSDLAPAMGMAPLDALFTLYTREAGGLVAIVFAMCEADLIDILKHPLGMVGSDGSSITPGGPVGKQPVHPRCYGTFPRVLSRYVREKQVLSLEAAIHKMTGLPAQKLGLKDRGLVREGMAADLVLFSPGRVKDRADFNHPHQYPAGIDHVFVNGTAVVRDGEHTGNLPGKRLYNVV